jgi:hypothetical protein
MEQDMTKIPGKTDKNPLRFSNPEEFRDFIEYKNTLNYRDGDWVEYTPKLARWVLDNLNPENRPTNKAHIEKIALEMTNGMYFKTNHGIGYDALARLIDGQHRLKAILESNTTQTMFVVCGIKPQAYSAIDQNITKRLAHAYIRHTNEFRAWAPHIKEIQEPLPPSIFAGTLNSVLDHLNRKADAASSGKIAVRNRLYFYLHHMKAFHFAINLRQSLPRSKKDHTSKVACTPHVAACVMEYIAGGDPERIKTFYEDMIYYGPLSRKCRELKKYRQYCLSLKAAPASGRDRSWAFHHFQYFLNLYVNKGKLIIKEKAYPYITPLDEDKNPILDSEGDPIKKLGPVIHEVEFPQEIMDGTFDPETFLKSLKKAT